MAAVVVPQIVHPLKLSKKDAVIFDSNKLEDHLIQQLSYNQNEASTLVDAITSLVRANNKSVLLTAAVWRNAPHLVNVMLQSVDPSERLRFIQIQADGRDDGLHYYGRDDGTLLYIIWRHSDRYYSLSAVMMRGFSYYR